MSSPKEDDLLKLCYSDISWDIVDAFSPLLDKRESTNYRERVNRPKQEL